jgi:hypothetical protein
MMRRAIVLYGAASVGLIALVAWLFTLAFHTSGSAKAIQLSALVAAVVQIGAFAATKLLAPRNVMAAWGAGSLLRLLTLIVYALLAVKVLGLAAAPALLSLVAFFFLSTLLEPLFLRR